MGYLSPLFTHFPQRDACLSTVINGFAFAPLPSLTVGGRIVTTAVVSIHTPTITLVVVRSGISGGHGRGHKHYHERSGSKNFNDTFQTSSPPSPSQGVRAIPRQEKELTPVACYAVTSAPWGSITARLSCAVGLNRVAVFVYDPRERGGGGNAAVIG